MIGLETTDKRPVGTVMLPAGRIGDIHGHRYCFLVAYIWLSVSSLMTGLSSYSGSFVFYSVCRGLQGIAAAMLVPSALAILGSVYKEGRRKDLVFSLYAAGSPLGFTLGSVFSALLAQLAWWPWIFYITAIVCGALGGLSLFAIPKLPAEYSRDIRSAHDDANQDHFDWLGAFTGVGGLTLLNIAWNLAPAEGWKAPAVITTIVVGFLLCIAFFYVERRVKQPLVPVKELSKQAGLVLAVTGLGWASFGIMIFYLINFMLNFRGQSLLSTAAQTVPVLFAGTAASYLNSWLLGRGVLSTDILAISLIGFIVGNILLATLPVMQLYWKQAFWIYVLAPFGMDLNFPSATLLMSHLVPPERQGIAASLIGTVVYYSQSIGMWNALWRECLTSRFSADRTTGLGIAGVVQAHIAGASPLKGYRGASYIGVGLGGLGFLLSVWPVVEQKLKKT